MRISEKRQQNFRFFFIPGAVYDFQNGRGGAGRGGAEIMK